MLNNELRKSGQSINLKKTKIDTVYHGVKFLGHITFPYGYQIITKEVKLRTLNNIKKLSLEENTIFRLNSIIGILKYFSTHKFIKYIIDIIPENWSFSYKKDRFIKES